MPKTSSKLVNWLLGVAATLFSTMLVGSLTLLYKLDTRTEKLVTILEFNKITVEKALTSISNNSDEIHKVKDRVTKLEMQNQTDAKYNAKIDRLHDTVKKIEGKMEN